MAQGDITKEYENDKIEVIQTWSIQVRKAIKIMEEQSDGNKKELSRSFHRHVLHPFNSYQDQETKKWTHTETDISGEDADVKAVANAVWTDTVKSNYKNWKESK